ncbi:MAG: ComEC/Rec2 family competence protein, partial [Nitrospirae bacterium]|nr:ComEC/Rec2 family competence protein [Nitrospirota bacterium]
MLLPITVAFLAGLVAGSFLPYVPLSILLILTVTAFAVTALEGRGQMTTHYGLALFCSLVAGILYWTAFIGMSVGSQLAELAGTDPGKVTGMVVEPVRAAPRRAVAVVAVSQIGEAAAAQPIEGRLRLTWRDPDASLKQGDLVTFTARLHPPSGTVNPGGFDYAAYLRRQGIDVVASLSGPGQMTVLGAAPGFSRWGFWRGIDEWREQIRRAAEASLHGPALGIYLSLIVGQPGDLAAEVRDAFMSTGTVHILSISGSHLGLIALLSFTFIRGLCRHLPSTWLQALSRRVTPTRVAALGTMVPVTWYALLAGGEVATIRSLVMILLFLLAVWLGREGQLLFTLAAAALLILVHDPRAWFDISFQLSYGSVLAIALVLRRLNQGDESPRDLPGDRPDVIVERIWVWLRLYGGMTGSVTLATVPLVAYHFNQIAWLGLVANLVVVPLAGLVLVPLGLGAAVWVLLTGVGTLPMGPVHQVLLDLLFTVVQQLAQLPGAAWHVASPSVFAMAGFYALLYGAFGFDGRPVFTWICVLGTVFFLCWWSWSPRVAADGDTLRVTFLDVGQGDASVIELPDGQTVLIDGGAVYETLDMGRAVVGPYLWDRGIRRLDHVIGTHPQLDHVGGLAWVLRSFEVGRYWGNGVERSEPFYQRLSEALRDRGLTPSVAAEGQAIVASGVCRLLVLNPLLGTDGSTKDAVALSAGRGADEHVTHGAGLNNLSVVTRLDCGPHSVLFAADAEVEALTR